MPPNTFSQNLQAQLMRFLAQERLHLTPSGRQQVEYLCERAAHETRSQQERTLTKRRWNLVIMTAAHLAQTRNAKELSEADFAAALKSLCPIWPFC
jgi:predicted ATP-dependent protease